MSLKQYEKEILQAFARSPWDFGNQVLYDLCKNYPKHKEYEVIIAKMWLIGRAYAAAIERRRNKEVISDDFYVAKVAPTLRDSQIDLKLLSLDKFKELNNDNVLEVLQTHKYLMDELNKITALDKRSLCSKYLHFHKPDLFVIYDTRAIEALRKFIKVVPKNFKMVVNDSSVDREYAKFVCKAITVKQAIEKEYSKKMTLRHFDSLLLTIANAARNAQNKGD